MARFPQAVALQNNRQCAYEEGLKQFWNPIKAYWADGSDAHRAALRAGLTLAATKSQYLDGVRDPARVAPDAWLHDQGSTFFWEEFGHWCFGGFDAVNRLLLCCTSPGGC